MTAAQAEAAGYRANPPVCISHPATGAGMGVHFMNRQLFDAQFPTAQMDPQNPPILLFDATMTRVVGLEWEAKDIGQGQMQLFGQNVPLLPGHPGLEEPHYMLHAYFRPNGQVLFAEFDPQLTCPAAPQTSILPDDVTPNVLTALGVTLMGLAIAVAAATPRSLARWQASP